MANVILEKMDALHPNTLFQRGIITVFGYFLDKGFNIVCSEADFGADLAPGIPQNWEQSIVTFQQNNFESHAAVYFIQLKDQHFTLSFYLNATDDCLKVSIFHMPCQRGYSSTLSYEEINGIFDLYREAAAICIADHLHQDFEEPVLKAACNQSPPTVRTPFDMFE